MSSLRENAPDAIHIVESLRLQNLKTSERVELGGALYSYGKCCLNAGEFTRAAHSFDIASDLTSRPLISERLRLLREVVGDRVNSVRWRSSLIEMQRSLSIVCHEAKCNCLSHSAIASCKGLIGRGLHHVRGSVEVHTLAAYHPYNTGDHWTKLLRRIKTGHEAKLLEPVTDILAEFIVEETNVLRSSDIVVPVPPSTDKYVDRGFAPNDIVANGLERRLALPCRQWLYRSSGLPTREASQEALSEQFTTKRGIDLSGLSVLLVEDIWTRGRTIPICAEKLRAVGAESVQAVALGKTS